MPQEFSGDMTAHALKVLRVEQVRDADKHTITVQGIASIDLMERAAARALEVCLPYLTPGEHIDVVCGTGNNGGDGLAIARMLHEKGYPVRAYLVGDKERSPDCSVNAERLRSRDASLLTEIRSGTKMPALTGSVVVDALFGTGLTRKIEGLSAQAVLAINRSGVPVFSIDLPSGMLADAPLPEGAPVVQATRTVTFQSPKLCFFFPMSARYCGEWTVIDIGLDAAFIENLDSRKYFVTRKQVAEWVHPRPKFSHKGNFGHAWLASGSRGMMGAAVLSGLACLKTGAGLLTVHVPRSGVDILQGALPEALVQADSDEDYFSGMTGAETKAATALAAGPGLSTEPAVHGALRSLIQTGKPLLLDADALNILSQHKEWLNQLPGQTVLTPHPKEFERLTSAASHDFERHEMLLEFSRNHNVVTVLKGAYTCTALPDGRCFFNSTGNPAMATAGSGDVLTGIILAMLAQGYPSAVAAILGVYVHGLAGDLAVQEGGPAGLLASEIAGRIPHAIRDLLETR